MHQYKVKTSQEEITEWFKGQGFKSLEFTKGKAYISSFWNGQSTSIKIKEKPGFVTYFKKAYGSAFLIFDVTIHGEILMYEAYTPIWLFAIWLKKVPFKAGASGIFKYRNEGYIVEEKFINWITNAKPIK